MITPEHLNSLIEGMDDSEFIEITKVGDFGPVGTRVVVMPGVAGPVIRHDDDGDSVVRVKVRAVRHAMRLVA